MSSHESLLAEFCALVDLGDVAKNNNAEFARSFLEGHQWQLEQAVNAYLEMKAEEGPPPGAADGEEQVRAPLPDVVDQLYDDSQDLIRRQMAMAMMAAQANLGGRATRNSARTAPAIDPFRNFASERPAAASATGGGSGGGGGGGKKVKHEAKLSALFRPPDDLIYVGPDNDSSFESAIAHALEVKKWLLINVQQGDEFASHQLNRDVWQEKAIHALVREHFIFCQPNHNTASGLQYRKLYNPPSIPTIAILDPVTRQRMWDAHAAGGRELRVDKKLIKHITETLKEFAARTDITATAPSAIARKSDLPTEDELLEAAIQASLAGSSSSADHHTPAAAAASSSSKAAASSSAVAAARPAASTLSVPTIASKAAGSAASAPIELDGDDDAADEEYVPIDDSDGEIEARLDRSDPDDDDDAVLPLATRSKPGDKRKRVAAAVSTDRLIEIDGEEKATKIPRAAPPPAASSSNAVAAAFPAAVAPSAAIPAAPPVAEAPLPPEPFAGTPDACRLQIRLPGGRPAQRRFLKTDPVKNVYTFTRSTLSDEMRSKPFLLVTSLPRRELKDMEATIDSYGIANASVLLEWL